MAGGKEGSIDVSAVIADLSFDMAGTFPDDQTLAEFRCGKSANNRNRLGITLVLCHLLHDEFFLHKEGLSGLVLDLFRSEKLKRLASVSEYGEFVTDTDKREELARLALDSLGFVPEGESEKLAADRLATLDSVERERILELTRKAQEKARRLREEMARREAEEAASKMGRE